MEAAEATITADESADPAELFVRFIQAALISNQVYLADKRTGGAPVGLEQVAGWTVTQKYVGESRVEPLWDHGPNTLRVGWTDCNHVYLDPDVSYQVAQKLARAQGGAFPLQKRTLHRRLDDAGKLKIKDGRNQTEGRNRTTARVLIEGRQINVLVFDPSEFWAADPPGTEAAAPWEGEV